MPESLIVRSRVLDEAQIDALIKLSGNSTMDGKPKEVKKKFLRELGLQIIADVPTVAIGTTLGSPLGPIGMFIDGSIGSLVGAYLGTAAERTIAGDPDPFSNTFTNTGEEALLILVGHGLGNVVSKGEKAVKDLFTKGREPIRNVVSRGFDAAIKDVLDIKISDVGEFLKNTAKQIINNPLQGAVAKNLAKKFFW